MIQLDHIRICLEGRVPATLATCDLQGMPNITYVSQAHYVDSRHIALTFQFFNKTYQNIRQNPQATLLIIDPITTQIYRLALFYKSTECEGPLFEGMKAKLAGIASSSGMENIFKLLGADIYQVMDIEQVPCKTNELSNCPIGHLLSLRHVMQAMSQASDLSGLCDSLLSGVLSTFDIEHAMVLLKDPAKNVLFTLGSRGYSQSGVGSEIPIGYGIIGTAAQFKTPIRITHMAAEYNYVNAMRDYLLQASNSQALETQIKYPGLTQPHSQMAVPVLVRDTLQGIIYVESPGDQYFDYNDEDSLVCMATCFAQTMDNLNHDLSGVADLDSNSLDDMPEPAVTLANTHPVSELSQNVVTHSANGDVGVPPLLIRYYRDNHSIFIDQEYIIKGVAGAILWRLLQLNQSEGRRQFSNKELRMDKTIVLPDFDDNLEARLILLRRRLGEKSEAIGLLKTGRGVFELQVNAPLELKLCH